MPAHKKCPFLFFFSLYHPLYPSLSLSRCAIPTPYHAILRRPRSSAIGGECRLSRAECAPRRAGRCWLRERGQRAEAPARLPKQPLTATNNPLQPIQKHPAHLAGCFLFAFQFHLVCVKIDENNLFCVIIRALAPSRLRM